MFSKLGVITLEKLRGIGYKLGLTQFKIEEVDLTKIPEVKVAPDYQYPHQHEQLEKEVREIHRKIEEGRAKYKQPLV